MQLGLPQPEIVKIAAHNGGKLALEAVLDKWDALTGKGLSRENIVKIASYTGAKKTLEAVVSKPRQHKLSKEELVSLVSCHRGSLALTRFLPPAARARGTRTTN